MFERTWRKKKRSRLASWCQSSADRVACGHRSNVSDMLNITMFLHFSVLFPFILSVLYKCVYTELFKTQKVRHKYKTGSTNIKTKQNAKNYTIKEKQKCAQCANVHTITSWLKHKADAHITNCVCRRAHTKEYDHIHIHIHLHPDTCMNANITNITIKKSIWKPNP